MKKTILIVFLAVFTLAFTACKKDKNATDTLAITTWTYQSADEKEVLEFKDDKNFTLTNTSDGTTFSFDGTYSYNAPDITINILGETINGKVDGDKLTLTNDGDSREYTMD